MNYYHVSVELNTKTENSKYPDEYFELDRTDLEEIKKDIIEPFVKKEEFEIDGYFVNPDSVKRIKVKKSNQTSKSYSKARNARKSPNILIFFRPSDIMGSDDATEDITRNVLADVRNDIDQKMVTNPKNTEKSLDKVFIVHGHDELALEKTARFIAKFNINPIILHEQVNAGKTIIEKIEEYSNVDFGIVLYTPCDIGTKKGSEENDLRDRARQNVIFEHGYLIGKLGRKNVCAIVKGDIELPNDISGIVYINMDDENAWRFKLASELKRAKYDIDLNLLY